MEKYKKSTIEISFNDFTLPASKIRCQLQIICEDGTSSFVHHTIESFLKFRSICSLKRRRQWHPTPVLLPGESHGRRSLVGCSPWGREE